MALGNVLIKTHPCLPGYYGVPYRGYRTGTLKKILGYGIIRYRTDSFKVET